MGHVQNFENPEGKGQAQVPRTRTCRRPEARTPNSGRISWVIGSSTPSELVGRPQAVWQGRRQRLSPYPRRRRSPRFGEPSQRAVPPSAPRPPAPLSVQSRRRCFPRLWGRRPSEGSCEYRRSSWPRHQRLADGQHLTLTTTQRCGSLRPTLGEPGKDLQAPLPSSSPAMVARS